MSDMAKKIRERRDKIAKLADALKVSPGYLMGWAEKETADPKAGGWSPEDLDLLKAFQNAPEYKRDAIKDLLGLK